MANNQNAARGSTKRYKDFESVERDFFPSARRKQAALRKSEPSRELATGVLRAFRKKLES